MKERYFHEEEHFHAQDRKESKKERRRVQKKDRSKFKKSDIDQLNKESRITPDDANLHTARVVAITGEKIWVVAEGRQYSCSLPGLMKKEKRHAKNLIAVGDILKILPIGPEEASIAHIEERYSMLSRMDITQKKEQLIAVNIDQVLIVASVASPSFKPALIDRYLIAAELGKMHPVIVINKIDLLENFPSEETFYRDFLLVYEELGYPIISVSAKTGVGLDHLRAIMKNKASVFSGQSGAGKSSLLNAAFGLELKVGEVAQKTYKGSHTTTMAQLLPLPDGGFCIDTPGIRSFGIWNLKREDVAAHFCEFAPFADKCRYHNCSHLTEPVCAVQKAVEEKRISAIRYESYCSLMKEILGGLDNRARRKLDL